jgi:hypothetical protein
MPTTRRPHRRVHAIGCGLGPDCTCKPARLPVVVEPGHAGQSDATRHDAGHPEAVSLTRARMTRKEIQTRTVHMQAAFLREFALCGVVLRAAQAAGVGRATVHEWKRENPAFLELMEQAHEDALDQLEEEARRRAHEGVMEPVYQGGKEVGQIRKYSDHLLMMFLKGKRRESFSERTETTGANGSALAPAVVLVSWHQSMKPPEQP